MHEGEGGNEPPSLSIIEKHTMFFTHYEQKISKVKTGEPFFLGLWDDVGLNERFLKKFVDLKMFKISSNENRKIREIYYYFYIAYDISPKKRCEYFQKDERQGIGR